MKKKQVFFTVNESKNFVHLVLHFMKWTVDFLSISRNGQIFCPFHEMDSWVVHFMKWTICLSILRNGQFHTWVVTHTQNGRKCLNL